MHKPVSASLFVLACLLYATPTPAARAHRAGNAGEVWILKKDGESVAGTLSVSMLHADAGGDHTVRLVDLLTFQSGEPASIQESDRITAGLTAMAGEDRTARDNAEATLTDIGLPTLSPLLATYKDTDLHEPNPLYRLFARIIPGYADRLDRTLDLFRLANGDYIRGKLTTSSLKLTTDDGKEIEVPAASIRRLAVRRKVIDRTFEVQALRHCTPIAFLDTGIAVAPASRLEETADGLARLSFNIDGWTTDPDGQKTPGPGHTSIIEGGFPFGTLVGRIGPSGPRWAAGRHIARAAGEAGRLYFAINDNGHWQNNIGSYRVKLHVTDAYDLGDPQ